MLKPKTLTPLEAVNEIRKDKGQVVMVLQGGGALGAYQGGVYQAMHEAGIEPDWIVGTSIGAINASIIAGNRSIYPLASAFLPKPHDGRVSIANTKIDGMADHIVIRASHPWLMRNSIAIAQTIAFLKDGRFVTSS